MTLILSFHTARLTLTRSIRQRCLCNCQEAARCCCAARCRCHLGSTTVALLTVGRVLRAARRPLPTFATVPNGAILWGGGKARSVRCEKCGKPLRSGVKHEVRQLGGGRWECVVCPTPARVPRLGGLARTLAASLATSIKAQ